MEALEITFKLLAILYSVCGILLLALTTGEGFQQICIYEGRNPLVGDMLKHLANGSGLALVVCGFAAFKLPIAAVALVWVSLVCHLLTGVVDSVASRVWPKFCVACAVNFAVRASAAVALTLLYQHGLRA
ncbi:hypothetical protein [Luteimonas sp. MC1572]|uniref:hypothetical protein n=1 Tax=Luteimonas sp. MC1572 TaxID=2799325 RepID=UPI0018F0DFEC|nr:hypothetical protein [Luteimonas sp. MC1572]MBJ6983028.1 hypothetical protein [Luteimonas sp. MC1572]QQO03234.1 hypothetical protein JGR64_00160 [Luteimonas sp. MC1572]